VEPVPDDQASAAGRLDIGKVPVTIVLRHRSKGPAMSAVPVKAVATEPDQDFIRFLSVGWLAAPDREQAQNQAFVCDCVEVIELRGHTEIGARKVEAIGSDPEHRILWLPARAGDRVAALPVLSHARVPWAGWEAVSDAEYPDVTKRIPESRRPVARDIHRGNRATPMDAITGNVEREFPAGVLVGAEKLVTTRRVGLDEVQPDGRGIPHLRQDDVGPGHNVELRLGPVDAVPRGVIAGICE